MLKTRKIKRKTPGLESAAYPFEVHRPATPDQRILLKKYPRFFRAVASPTIYQCPLAHWGIECGKGWYPLVEEAAAKIEAELKKLLDDFCSGHHLSWIDRRLQNIDGNSILNDVDADDGEEPLIPFCTEVKEKAGTLCILVRSGHMCDGETWVRIRNVIKNAERKSETTCERCGLPGMTRNFWDRVYCESCASGN
jgi:hypothetical protein